MFFDYKIAVIWLVSFTIYKEIKEKTVIIADCFRFYSDKQGYLQDQYMEKPETSDNQEITQLEIKLKQLQSENCQLKNLIENLPGDIYWKNQDGAWSGINISGANTLIKMGFIKNRNDILGKTDYDLFGKETADAFRKNDLYVMTEDVELICEEINTLPSGQKIIQLSTKRALHDEHGNISGIVGTTIDISYLKKVEHDLKLAKEKAEIANRAKSEFIANMSHDIRTPLSGIVGMSALLEEESENAEQKNYARCINESGQQLLSLLNGILDIISADHANEQDIRSEVFDLRLCLDDLIQLERPTTRMKNLELELVIDPAIPKYVKSDRSKIHRILLNLLGNAIKFTQVGKVIINVQLLEQKKDNIRLLFQVIDTGIGIPLSLQEHVFDRFFRAHPSHKGTYSGHGVGLHIAQSYVKLLGGEIKLKSKEGEGTSFYFELNLKAGNKKLAGTEKNKVFSGVFANSKNKPRLLIVEDNPIALRIIETFASKAGCEFTSIHAAEPAFDLLKSGSYDLIITDLGLPGINGKELTRSIREWETEQKREPLIIIGLTAHTVEEAKEECLRAGMNDVYTKPIDMMILQKIIAKFSSPEKEHTQSTSLGVDLPASEAELFELEHIPLFDEQNAASEIGAELLNEMIQLMVDQEIPESLAEIKAAHSLHDWQSIQKLAHKMKGSAVYCGLDKMRYACQYIERYEKAGHTALLEELYTQLIRIIKETNLYLVQYLNNISE